MQDNTIKVYSKEHGLGKQVCKNNKGETYLYEDKKLKVRGCTYKVTMLFPMPDSGAETVEDKLKYLINGYRDEN